jgi:hypothetical protein
MSDLDNYINSLNDKEKEDFKDLISECQNREKDLNSIFKNIYTNMNVLTKSHISTISTLENLNIEIKNLHDKIKILFLEKTKQKDSTLIN